MPSLGAIQAAEDVLRLPVFSAATATTYEILDHLDLSTRVPGAGRLLAGGINAPTERVEPTMPTD